MAITDKKLTTLYTPIKLTEFSSVACKDSPVIVDRVSEDRWIVHTKGSILVCKRNNVRRFKSLFAISNFLETVGIDKVTMRTRVYV